MSGAVDVQVDGANRLASTLRSASRRLADVSSPARSAAQVIGAAARARTPVRTGLLRASITVRSETDGASVGTSVRYAPYVNFGTRYVRARPFLTDAAERGAPLALAAYERTTNRALAQVRGA